MTRDEYAALPAEIGGGADIGLAARRERSAAEHATLARHGDEIWGLLCLGDSLHQFYRDTLGPVAVALPVANETQSAMANWHLVSFNRFAAAFHLMAHGYYFEAMMLVRDLWEVALSLAAVRKNVVTLEQVLTLSETDLAKAEARSRETDREIRR